MGRRSRIAEPDSYRVPLTGPLMRPLHLWLLIAFWTAGTVLCAWAAWHMGTFWAAFLPALPAIPIGMAIVGLEPGYWFKRADKTDISDPR